MKILLYKGRGLISWSIRWFTRSRFSHAAIMLPNGDVIEAWQGAGVRITQLKSRKNVVSLATDLNPEQAAAVESFLLNEVGSPYDYWNILGFITRRPRRSNRAWHCSEIVYAAYQAAGVNLLGPSVNAWEVTPGMLYTSPLLTVVDHGWVG
jgi:uncharacterized protein YycO